MTPAPEGQSLLARTIVGRDAERRALAAALDAAKDGRGSAVAVLGERGIGKSRLLRDVAEQARAEGLLVLTGRAVPVGRTPYRPLAEAVLPLVDDLLAPPVAPVLSGLNALAAALQPRRHHWLESGPLVVAETLRRVLSAQPRAVQGAVLLLDDLHWADPETLEAVEHLVESAPSARFLLVLSARDDEHNDAVAMARRMHSRRTALILVLRRLLPPEVLTLAADALGAPAPPGLSRELGRAEGLPFLIEELLAALARDGALRRSVDGWDFAQSRDELVPPVVLDLVREHLSGLDESARSLLQAAAVVGDLQDGVAAAASGIADDTVSASLAALIRTGLLREGSEGAVFRHALIREATLTLVTPSRARDIARRALHALEELDPALSGARVDLAVEIAGRTGENGTVARFLLLAARRAMAAGALVSAERALRRARDVAPREMRVEAEDLLVRVLAEAGLVDECLETGAALLHRLDVSGADAGRLLDVRARLASTCSAAGRDPGGHLLAAADLLAVLPADARGGWGAALDLIRAQAALARGDIGAAQVLARSATSGAPEVASAAWLVLGRCARFGDLDGARDLFSRALAVAERADLPVDRLRALGELATVDLIATSSRARLEEALRLALESGAWASAVAIQTQLAWWWEDRGDGHAVVGHATAASELAERLHAAVPAALARVAQAVGHALNGDSAAAERALAVAASHAPDHPDVLAAAEGHARALTALLEEDRELALEHLRRAVGVLGHEHHPPPMPMWGLWALLEAVCGDHGQEAVARVRANRVDVHAMVRGYLHLTQAVLAGRAGDGLSAVRELAAGRRRMTGLEPFHALALRHVGAAALEDGWGDPAPLLTAALDVLDGRGMATPAGACRALLRRAGVAPPRRRGDARVPAQWQALGVTPREAEVLALLAIGTSTRNIAQRLHLSVKTVERHTANLAAKVGLQGRGELVAFASRSVSQNGGFPDALTLPQARR